METIAVFDFDTAHLPVGQRFEAFAQSISNSQVEQLGGAPFSCRARFWKRNPLLLSEQWVDSISFARDMRRVRTTGTDHFQLTVPLEGGITIKRPNGDLRCEAGHAMVSDLTRAETVHADRQHSLTIQIPRHYLHAAMVPVNIHGPLPHGPATRLLVSYLADLAHEIADMPQAAATALADTLRDLLVAALAGLPPHVDPASSAIVTRRRARDYIENQPAGALDIAAMCHALGVTRATLYRLFKPDGGVLAYDRRRRLVALHRALADPREQRSLAELGFAFGFPDKSHLSHVFREAFQYTASELRAYYDARPADPALPGSAQARYAEMVRALA